MEEHKIFIFINLLTLWIKLSHLHPVQDDSFPEYRDHFGGLQNEIPDNKVEIQSMQDNVLSEEQDLNGEQQSEFMEDNSESFDEDEESYRKQETDTSSAFQRNRVSRKSQNEVKDGAMVSSSNSKCNQQRMFSKTGEDSKLNAPVSLYSDLKQVSDNRNKELSKNNQHSETDPHLKKGSEFGKNVRKPQFFEDIRHHLIKEKRSVGKVNQKVYKPINFHAEFPVYDEDIDFCPDPLHGLLEERYWENQQDKGDIIKKYIDLAANKMVPHGMEIEKRDVGSGKCGFDERGEGCPCNQIEACKDCKKGKQEEIQGAKTTTNRAKYSQAREQRSPSVNDDEITMEETNPNEVYFSRKLMSLEIEDINREELEDNYPTYVKSWEDEGEDKHSNQEMKDLIFSREKYMNKNKNYGMRPFDYEERGEYSDNFDNIMKEHNSFRSLRQNERSDQITTKLFERTNLFQPLKQYYLNSTFVQPPIFEVPTRNPNLYVPNKVGNMMQKVRQKKIKSPSKSIKPAVNASQEFEALEYQIFQNVTEITSTLHNNKLKRKRDQDNKKGFYFHNGKRRSPEGTFPYPLPTGSTLNQSSYENKLNIFNSTLNNTMSSIPTNVTFSTIGKTSTTTTTTPFVYPTQKKHNHNQLKASEEENVDAEIANDIVETVMIESQKDAMLGHNLGLYRRNESVVSVNYGKVVPETEQIVRVILNCIMDKMKDHLAKQSCIVLDVELLDFLKWLVLTGEPYKDYSRIEKKLSFAFKTDPQLVDHKRVGPQAVGTTCVPVGEVVTETSTECELDDSVNMNFETNGILSPAT